MKSTKRLKAEIKSLEERMTPPLPSNQRIKLIFTEPNLLKTESVVVIRHPRTSHKDRHFYQVASVKALNQEGEQHFIALLDPVTG